MKKFIKISAFIVGLLIVVAIIGMMVMKISPIGLGMHDPIYTEEGVALGGYDVVAYFADGKATPGSAEFSTKHNGVEWHFSSQQHMDEFAQDPERYLPACGGHCSFAATTGFSAPGSGEFFMIVNEELFILSNPEVMTEFEADPEGMAAKAKGSWK